ncbi:hypothetical protein LG314_07035 [Agrococcus terreus]|uniref:hypothetical protein n=1 Tax=Agrococcus terreus TaxID=574649 RepID=UPI003850751C
MDDERTTIAGHPLVRLLRRDDDREAWVAADGEGAGVELHRATAGRDAVLAREAEAVAAAAHPHLVPVLDVAHDGGAVLLRPLLPRDLAGWLVARGAPEPGEAVTALAPVAAALAALHAVGAAAGGVTAQAVRLDADGAPLLMAEGAAVEQSPPTAAWRESSAAVARDAAGWRALAETLLDAAGEPLPPEVERALAERDLAAAGDALLAAWPALPLALEAPRASAPARRPAPVRRRERPDGLRATWDAVAAALDRMLGGATGGRAPSATAAQLRVPAALLHRAPAAMRAVRPRFWLAAGAGAAALALAGGLAATADGSSAATPPEPTPAVVSTPAPAAATEGSAPPTPTAEPAPPTSAPAADDPVAATRALLAEREACLDAADAGCLVGLHDPASPLLAADDPWRMPADGQPELVQRLGDAWLLRIASGTAPASVLVMSTEAGWTLRDAWEG